jgi:hypothetical protein
LIFIFSSFEVSSDLYLFYDRVKIEIYRGFELLDLVLRAGIWLANDGDDVHLVVQVLHGLKYRNNVVLTNVKIHSWGGINEVTKKKVTCK